MYYCTNCGKESKTKICNHCGVKNNRVHNYCSWCGEKLNAHAVMCPNCKEAVKKGFFSKIPSALWIFFCLFMFSGHTFIDGNIRAGLLYIPSGLVALPFVGRFIKRITFAKERKKVRRLGWNIFRVVLALVLFIVGDTIAMNPNSSQIANTSKLSSYTYDEYVMYSTMTRGYGKILDSLKNPRTADCLGISYDEENNIAYFCIIAENDFGGNTKSYIQYSRKTDKIYEDDSMKYYYDSAEINRSFDDLYAFMKAAETADESDVPTQGVNEALEAYSTTEQKMYELLIGGADSLEAHYDDLFIVGYKYSTSDETAYFFFTGKEYGSLVGSHASYTRGAGLMVSDAYETFYENADITIYPFEIDEFKEARKKDISK